MLEFRDEQEKLLLGSEHTPGFMLFFVSVGYLGSHTAEYGAGLTYFL